MLSLSKMQSKDPTDRKPPDGRGNPVKFDVGDDSESKSSAEVDGGLSQTVSNLSLQPPSGSFYVLYQCQPLVSHYTL